MHAHAHQCIFLKVNPYQQQVIKEEHLPLERREFLFVRFVGIGNLKQTAAAHQPSVGHSEDLKEQG